MSHSLVGNGLPFFRTREPTGPEAKTFPTILSESPHFFAITRRPKTRRAPFFARISLTARSTRRLGATVRGRPRFAGLKAMDLTRAKGKRSTFATDSGDRTFSKRLTRTATPFLSCALGIDVYFFGPFSAYLRPLVLCD